MAGSLKLFFFFTLTTHYAIKKTSIHYIWFKHCQDINMSMLSIFYRHFSDKINITAFHFSHTLLFVATSVLVVHHKQKSMNNEHGEHAKTLK